MTLSAGTRLGPYEILAKLGEGGMGEVYRARDTRLDRTVAIKVLPAESSDSSEAAARFEREARAISKFSHPHICQLHDVGIAGGTPFLVMELVDGETLASRLAKGALPFDEVKRLGMQMADALDAAHRAGIVHRDLKPGNVMLPRSGLKLLDFGLARASDAHIAATLTPTLAPVTGRGSVAGTIAYMAPEVLEGQPADARSDIYALGTVLYEMATGRRHFTDASQTVVPESLDRIIRGCLARDPEERWQSARDVRLQLAASTTHVASPSERPRAGWLPWAVAAAAVLAAVIAWTVHRPSPSPAGAPLALDIGPPEGGAFVDTVETSNLALSQDGTQLAYVASDRKGVTQVWVRPLSAASGRPVAGTEGARHVFWAPDGKSIGFVAGEKLRRVDLPDGTPVTVADVPDVRIQASWGDGEILYAILPAGIWRVPVAGGTATRVVSADPAKGEIAAGWPWFLPDGKRFLFLVRRADGTGTIRIGEPGKPPRDVVGAASMAQVLDGKFLVYARESTLVAQRFDGESATVSGEPAPIAEPVRYFMPTGAATFSVSQAGVLVHQSHLERGRLVWLERSGVEAGSIGDDSGYSRVRIAPDGRRVLFNRNQTRTGGAHLWVYDVERKIEQRLTAELGTVINPLWLPNDEGVLYSGRIPPHLLITSFATGSVRDVLPEMVFTLPEDITPDGKTLLYTQRTPRGTFDMWSMPLANPAARALLRETPFDEASVRFSRDGRFIAYESDELGTHEVFVSSFPLSGSPVRVSAGGGSLPRWSRDGRELFYVNGEGWLVSVPVRTAPAFAAGPARRLFEIKGGITWADIKTTKGWADYDVSADGRFLAVVPEPANLKPVTVLVNWRPAAR